jgi:hypothetical protein
MSDDEKPSPEELERRRRWFDGYVQALDENSVVRPAASGKRWACPCCHFLTLHERGGFDICQVCFWEDDGQDDQDAAVVRGGPNGALSLERARQNFAAYGACDERFKTNVRAPLPEERGDAG